MAALDLREAQKGVFAATVIVLLVVPAIVVSPDVVSYKLFGHLGDPAYGKIVRRVVPNCLSCIFAAAITWSVLAHFTSRLNSSAALNVCDIHEKFVNPSAARLNLWSIVRFVLLAIVPLHDGARPSSASRWRSTGWCWVDERRCSSSRRAGHQPRHCLGYDTPVSREARGPSLEGSQRRPCLARWQRARDRDGCIMSKQADFV